MPLVDTLTRYALGSLAAIAPLGMAMQACAADWAPSDRIVMVSHSSAGTSNDLMLREIADIWTKSGMVGKQVSVENVTGARGENARRFVAQRNEGNPHMLIAFTPASVNQALLAKSQYTYRRFTPIAMMANDPDVLVVNSESPYRSLKDLVAAARQKPRSILQGGGPYGNSAAMAGRVLEEFAKVNFTYTPFKGGGEAVVALLGNHVQFVIENPGEVEQHVSAGKLRALVVSDKLPQFPNVPTYAEAGFDLRVLKQFRAVLAPPGIPAEAARYYVGLLQRTLGTPQWKEYEKRNALVESWVAGPELARFLEQQEAVYRDLDRQMGLLK